jgi:4-hydroxy-tetrahydrodipicolinate synthase
MTEKLVRGVYAAVLTPRGSDDGVDEESFASHIRFLREREVEGFAINGATGEYCLSTPRHLRSLFSALHRIGSDNKILCGIGAAGTAGVLELARIAVDEGAQAVLLPMPYFFPYEQSDLEQFVHTVAAAVELPILLYNLPSFTTALETETVLRLLRDIPHVIGIKDSGSSLRTLHTLKSQYPAACRIVGNDGMLASAIKEDVCDGVVSGVACVLPELILDIFHEDPASNRLENLTDNLETFIQHIRHFPVPWGLKYAAQARGILRAAFSQPVSPQRAQQGRELMGWFQEWHQEWIHLFQSTPQ